MANFINKYSDLAAYNADETKEYPNVSYLETEDEVKWQATEPIDQEYVVAKYDVTTTTAATSILSYTNGLSTSMEVDGVEVPIAYSYTFNTTGSHTIKYEIVGNLSSNFKRIKSLTSVTIPDSITSVTNSFFEECSGLTKVHIPSGATTIGDTAFVCCSDLTTITIPDSVTDIGNSAFYYCSGLTSVVIPSGVTNINGSAFMNCKGLTSITVNVITPPTMGTQVFNDTNNCPIYVPSASVNTYKAASGWSAYASRIQAIQ